MSINLEPLGRQSGRGYGQVKHLGYRGAYGAFILHLVAHHHIVGHDARLSVGGSGEEVEPGLARKGMGKLDGVAHGVDIGDRGLQIVIDPDATHLAQTYAGSLGQSGLGPHADAEQHHVGLEADARLEVYGERAVVARKGVDSLLQIELHALLLQMLVDERRHRIVDGRHHLVGHLDHRHLGSGVHEVFGHLESYEPSAHDDGTLHIVVGHIGLDAVGVGHIAQREDALAVDARQRRHHWRGTGRKQEFVVRLDILAAVGGAHGHLAAGGVDGDDLAQCAHIYIEPAAERLGRLHKQTVTVGDDTAYVIRQSTVGIRDIGSFLDEDNLCFLGQATYTRGGGGSSGHSTYYNISRGLGRHSGKGWRVNSLLILGDGGFEVGERHGSALSPLHLSALEEHQRGHRLDAHLHGGRLVLVDVDLDDADAVAEFLLELFQHWVHHLAWSAPGSVKVNQRELAALDNVC